MFNFFSHHLILCLGIAAFASLSGSLKAAPERSKSSDSEKQINQTDKVLLNAAREIDIHIAKLYRRKKISVPDDANDATYLRRTYLVTVGRIPTAQEAESFLQSDDPKKKEILLNTLINSKGYTSHMGNWLLDMLRVREIFAFRRTAASYIAWVRKAVAENMPFDQLTRELLSAEGGIWSNGAVGYYIRDKGMPLDNIANTMRLFLGTRVECAQCHDDPFGDWERMDFYRLAAFTSGQKEINGDVWKTLWRRMNNRGNVDKQLSGLVRFIGYEIYYPSLVGDGSGRIKLPADYQYSDGDPGEWVSARTPNDSGFGRTVRMSKSRDGDDGKARFADWVTNNSNDRFTTIIVNRMWRRIMGTALFEPIDQYVSPEKTSSPALTRYLVGLMRDLNYDLRKFQHALLLTRVYGFASAPHELKPGKKPIFNGRQIERMTAEQYWDSLVTLVKGNPDKLPTRKVTNKMMLYNRPVLLNEIDMHQLEKEVLAIKTPNELEAYAKRLLRRIEKDKKSKKKNTNDMMMMEAPQRHGGLTGIARASELASPAPHGHVLQVFGQSDRDLLEASTKEANASQVLAMLNGQVETIVVSNKKAHINKHNKGNVKERIRSFYLGTLSRLPRPDEMKLMEAEVAARGKEGYRNILSALVNTREFLFIP